MTHIHIELPQDVADRLPEDEEFSCRLVWADDGTPELCVTPVSEPGPERSA